MKYFLSKLQYYGVTGNALNRFSSYLTNRTQSVEINGVYSDTQNIELLSIA